MAEHGENINGKYIIVVFVMGCLFAATTATANNRTQFLMNELVAYIFQFNKKYHNKSALITLALI